MVNYYLSPAELPIIKDTYYTYDDGKIKPSRQYQVVINDIIPFTKASEEVLSQWQARVEQSFWLYSETTDYFVSGTLTYGQDVVYARTKDGAWFSIGDIWDDAGRLDVSGDLTKEMEEWYEQRTSN